MKTDNEIESFLFNENTAFTELLIKFEMESEEEYEFLKEQILGTLNNIYKYREASREQRNSVSIRIFQKTKMTSVQKSFLFLRFKLEGSFVQGALKHMTFPEFAEHLKLHLVFMVTDRRVKTSNYAVSAEGLWEAVKEHNGIAEENHLV